MNRAIRLLYNRSTPRWRNSYFLMKTFVVLIAVLLILFETAGAQTRKISKVEYDRVLDVAVRETNNAFPFVFTVKTELLKDGKVTASATEVAEREGEFRERITRTKVVDGKTSKVFQLRIDLQNNFCSDDGATWRRSQYECSGPEFLYEPGEPESVEYTVADAGIDGQPVKIYREYSVYSPVAPGKKKDFRESIAMIDSRGFFISVVDTDGTLDPNNPSLRRTQIWDFKTKFKPVTAPVN